MRGKLIWSRQPDMYEMEVVEDYIRDLILKRFDVSKFFIYVNLDTEEGGIEIINYPEQSIKVLAKELGCSDKEALYCVGKFPGFLQELRGMLYWNDINDLKKFLITTRELDKKEQTVYRTAVSYATSKNKAHKEFIQMGFDVESIKDVDEA